MISNSMNTGPETANRKSSVQSRSRVLVVDDEPGLRRILDRILSRQYDVVTAGSGCEAQKILEANQDFDVILCDMLMPGMSGPEFYEWVQEGYPALGRRLAFITGGPTSLGGLELSENVPYINKPFRSADILNTVNAILFRARAS